MHRGGPWESRSIWPGGWDQTKPQTSCLIYPQPYGSGLLGDVKCDFAILISVQWSPCASMACADGQRLVSRLEAYLTYFFAVFFTAWLTVSRRFGAPAGRRSSGISLPAMGDPSPEHASHPGEAEKAPLLPGDVVEGRGGLGRVRSPAE